MIHPDPPGPLLLLRTDNKLEPMQAALAAVWPDQPVVTAAELTATGLDPAAIRVCVTFHPGHGTLTRFPNLELVVIDAAGADGVIAAGVPDGVTVARLRDEVQAAGMADYVLAQVLAQHKFLPLYRRQQRARDYTRQPHRGAVEVPVTVLGYGHIGAHVAAVLRAHGYPVRAWARATRQSDDPGLSFFQGPEQLLAAAAGAQALVCLLPGTAATVGILDAALFAAMAPGSHLIHVGRGPQLVVPDLLAALDTGQLAGACLDVQPQEPPPVEDPLWTHPAITLTPHIASDITATDAARGIRTTVEAYFSGAPVPGRVEIGRGY